MDNEKELLQALNGIQAELQRINKTLGELVSQKGRAAATERPAGRAREEGGYGRPERKEPVSYGGSNTTPRFGKKKDAKGAGAKTKPGMKPKKGGGYPKKTRG